MNNGFYYVMRGKNILFKVMQWLKAFARLKKNLKWNIKPKLMRLQVCTFNNFLIKIDFMCSLVIQFVDYNLLLIKHGVCKWMHLFKGLQTRLLMRQGIMRQWRQKDQQPVTARRPDSEWMLLVVGGGRGDAPSPPSNLFSKRRRTLKKSLKCTAGC